MIIETERLRLRAGKPADIADFVRHLNDWEVQQWLTIPPFPYKHEDGEAYLKIIRSNHATILPSTFVVADKASDAALGAVSINIDAHSVGELGYWLARVAWGRGVMKEAVLALLLHAKDHPALRRIVAVTDPENLRSQRVLLASGFVDRGLSDRPQPSRRGSTQVHNYELPIDR